VRAGWPVGPRGGVRSQGVVAVVCAHTTNPHQQPTLGPPVQPRASPVPMVHVVPYCFLSNQYMPGPRVHPPPSAFFLHTLKL
jgi:hypothetical protein